MTLVVQEIVAGYGAHDEVLKRVYLSVAEHEFVVLIGPNGAGKSTLLKTIAGHIRPRSGQIDFSGQAIQGRRPREVARCGIAFVPQEANVFPSLSIEENLEMGGYLDHGQFKSRVAAVYQRLPNSCRAAFDSSTRSFRRPTTNSRGWDGANAKAAPAAAG